MHRNLIRTGLLCLAVIPALPAGAGDRHPPASPNPSITVTGFGSVKTPPDTVHFQAGATTTARSAAEAVARNNAVVERLQSALREFGVTEQAVQTEQLDISIEYGGPDRGHQREVTGYRVTNVMRVAFGDLPALGKLLDVLVREGANVLRSIEFSVAAPAEYEDDARREAMADARRKAQILASEANVRRGRVLEIAEGGMGPVQPLARSGIAVEAAGAVPVAPGQVAFKAVVRVRYAIEAEP